MFRLRVALITDINHPVDHAAQSAFGRLNQGLNLRIIELSASSDIMHSVSERLAF